MKVLIKSFAVALALALPFSYGSTGSAAGLFMNLDADAAGMAQGGAMVARASGPAAAAWNPAALSGLGSRFEVLANYMSWVASFQHLYAATAFRVNSNLVVGADFRFLAPSGVDDPTVFLAGQDATAFNNMGIGVTAVGTLKMFSLGVSVRYLSQTIATTTTPALTLGAGFLAVLGTTVNRVNLGVSVFNLGTAIPGAGVAGVSVAQNFTLRAGGVYLRALESPVLQSLAASAEAEYAVDSGLGGRFGLEAKSPLFNKRFSLALRAGAQVSADVQAFTAGLGLDFGRFVVDWALSPRAGLGVVQSIGTTFRF